MHTHKFRNTITFGQTLWETQRHPWNLFQILGKLLRSSIRFRDMWSNCLELSKNPPKMSPEILDLASARAFTFFDRLSNKFAQKTEVSHESRLPIAFASLFRLTFLAIFEEILPYEIQSDRTIRNAIVTSSTRTFFDRTFRRSLAFFSNLFPNPCTPKNYYSPM